MAYRRALYRRFLPLIVVIVFVALRLWQGFDSPNDRTPPSDENVSYYVVRVVDGDTIIISETPASDRGRTEYYLRLLGIDTPETVKPDHPIEAFGPEASEFTKAFLAEGVVQLRFDRRRVDRYDRMLAYVFVDGTMLNEELCRAGLARVLVYPGDSESMARRMRKARDEARQAKRGIWSG